MATFQYDPTSQELDYRILRDGGVSLYFSDEVLKQDVEWLEQERYKEYSFDRFLP